MAVMLVRGLGYDTLAADAGGDLSLPFSDVGRNAGYIAVAYDFGIITGKPESRFDPDGTATREEAAAMMVRAYDRYSGRLRWLHGFYAFSSWPQREIIPDMDAVSLGWSRMEYSAGLGVSLNTSSGSGNESSVPSGYSSALEYLRENHVPAHLNVYMSTAQRVTLPDGAVRDACREILLSAENRARAVEAIVAELTRTYPEGETDVYAGVTIDFENMGGEDLKSGFTAFLRELRAALDPLHKTLYVTVQPLLKSGDSSFDAFDYRAIGEIADKVILMAHDYAADAVPPELMAAGFTATPVSPFDEVYFALRAVTDPETGVQDRDKLVLGVSISSAGWCLIDGKVVNASAMKPAPADIVKRLLDPATSLGYSERYKNPYITYFDESDGTDNVVWYEDERCIRDKILLARMFGVTGLSVWRIGLVPDYAGDTSREIYYDVWSQVLSQE
jgi:hypothetical protein